MGRIVTVSRTPILVCTRSLSICGYLDISQAGEGSPDRDARPSRIHTNS